MRQTLRGNVNYNSSDCSRSIGTVFTFTGIRKTTIPLREVRVRPVRPEEEPQGNALLHAHHYLGFRKLCGAQLKQVAVWGDRWLALLGWQEAALHCGPRDRWLGWTP